MKLANRIDKVPPYLFVEISRKIAEKKAQGIDVVSFGIGDPDIPTPQPVIDELRKTALDSPNHRYPETDGLPEFRRAIAEWYEKRFSVSLDPDTEVLPLIGAKEGIGHASLCFIDPGDIALVPAPGYPVYSVGTWFAGGECEWMPLFEKNGWLPDLERIPSDVSEAAKVMWLNYPNNPTGAVADLNYFEEVVRFSQKYNIPVMHDACYSEVAYDDYKPVSFLQNDGAKSAGLEFHSLSKSFNMTGWRVGMAVGNAEMIEALMVVKSNLDSGVPQAIQHMAIEALNLTQDEIHNRNRVYQSRRDLIIQTLRDIGMHVDDPKASLYVWARIPDGFTSAEFTSLLLEQCDVVVTPGSGYGSFGEGYIRLSITTTDDQIKLGLDRLRAFELPNK